jgi:flavin-dependent dehydrogenase
MDTKQTKELSAIDKALLEAQSNDADTSFDTADKLEKFKTRMGRGQPKKEEQEKAKNKTLLYWNDEEIEDIIKVAELNGFSKKDKNKYLKSIVRKVIRSELRQFG